MARFSPRDPRCLEKFSDQSRTSELGPRSSPVVRALAVASSSGLVFASAGFGAVFAWGSGSAHGVILGALSVVMALALEIAKPVAIAASLVALRSWRLVQGLLLAALGLVAVAYSLSAELSLIATTRGDRAAERAAVADAAVKASARYERARIELASLSGARPVAELQASIDALLRTPGANRCTKVDGSVSRKVCPKVDQLRVEQARAHRRSELVAILDEGEKSRLPSVGAADPGAAALAAYLGIFGVKVETALLTDLLILIGVVALEVGSALAGLLVAAVSGNTSGRPGTRVPSDRLKSKPDKARPVFQARKLAERGGSSEHVQQEPTAALGETLMEHLRRQGGRVKSGQRALARRLGSSTTEMHRAIHALAAAGLIIVAADRFAGTTLELAA